MKREDIEKAAEECRLTTAQSMGVYGQYHSIDECPEHGLSCDELVEGSFIKGAEWRINSVWHDASEVPEEHRFCLYILKGGTYGCGYYHKEDNSIWYSRFTNIVKWAYFQDITPNMED